MTYETLQAYLVSCEIYGWKASITGAEAFRRQVKQGIRQIGTEQEKAPARLQPKREHKENKANIVYTIPGEKSRGRIG